MRLSKRAIGRALFGAIGGIVAWILVEPFTYDVSSLKELFENRKTTIDTIILAFVGASIGTAIVGLDEILWGLPQRAIRTVLIAGLLGIFGSAIAFTMGGRIFHAFAPLVSQQEGYMQHFWLVIARSLTWTLLGGLIGLALGFVRKSWRGALNSGLGGLLGGLIGGLLFDTVAPFLGASLTLGLAEPGWGSRLIGLTSLGAFIGLFSSLAEQFFAPAMLKVISSGRMEGRLFPVDNPVVTIGRDERCDVTLYYDREVLPKHAVLRWVDGGYFVLPEGNAEVKINNQPEQNRSLKDKDIITVGQTKLMFLSRKTMAFVSSQRPFPCGKICSSCGAENRLTAKFCQRCGHSL